MRVHNWKRWLGAAVTCAVLATAMSADLVAQRASDRGWSVSVARETYQRGYRDGLRQGEQDARRGRAFDYVRDGAYRSGDRGYNRSYGNREAYRTEFRRGFAAGYRTGYDQVRRAAFSQVERNSRQDALNRRGRAGYQDPAYARGYAEGVDRGRDDSRARRRYDPVGHRAYRQADQGYSRSYGSRDAYQNNYRAGFRQGYDVGYRR